MRLAFCNATRRWGGVKTWTVEFAAALRDMGHDVSVYGKPGAFIERALSMDLDATGVPSRFDFDPACIAWFYREFKRKNFEAVLVNVGRDMRTAGVAARMLGLPIIHRIGLPGDLDNTLKARLTHKVFKPHYLCPCYFVRDGLVAHLPHIQPQDISVVYSAKPLHVDAPCSVNSPLRFISTSRVVPIKGHLELAHTFAALMRDGFDFHWNIVGTGNLDGQLHEICARLGLLERTTFHGFVQNVSAKLVQNDVFVMSSYVEGLPNSLLEAMAHGLAPAGRAVGGVSECWPKDLPNELLVPYEGWERHQGWENEPTTITPEELPLYGPLHKTLTATPAEILDWKKRTRAHCGQAFSLRTQAAELEAFFKQRLHA